MKIFDRPRLALSLAVLSSLAVACGDDAGGGGSTSSAGGAASSASGAQGTTSASGSGTATSTSSSTGGGGPCTTRVDYGDTWIHGADHPDSFDVVDGPLTWDGVCTNDGANSYAVLSNGWKPYFTGHGGCVMALDTTCAPAPACTTRITYGPSWIPAPNHPASYDDVAGEIYWNRGCTNEGADSFATLSNGWAPHFTGANACDLSFSYLGCGGLYRNPVVDQDCPDPGVLAENGQYVVACTSGGAPNAFPIRTSTDLIHFDAAGSIFPSGSKPAWATGDFWAPEIHHVGGHYVAYFSARHQNGRLSIGAATSPNATGPFTDIGHPLVEDASLGLIDANAFDDGSGTHYVVWKVDGNAVGQKTPIYGQALSADGTSLVGNAAQLITNDEGWEGGVVEGPWVYRKDGFYYLFYSGNAYYDGTYAVGVARASSPLGPYTKLGSPILTTDGAWVGPGHCSVVDTPSGETAMVYHAWHAGQVNGPGDARVMLVDPVAWGGGWPGMLESPSVHARPAPALP